MVSTVTPNYIYIFNSDGSRYDIDKINSKRKSSTGDSERNQEIDCMIKIDIGSTKTC
jgi:hypothetical protein